MLLSKKILSIDIVIYANKNNQALTLHRPWPPILISVLFHLGHFLSSWLLLFLHSGCFGLDIYIYIYIYIYISYSTIVLYSRDRYKIIGLREISKTVINTSKLLKQSSTLAKQSGNRKNSKTSKFQALPKFCLPDGPPACCKTRFH